MKTTMKRRLALLLLLLSTQYKALSIKYIVLCTMYLILSTQNSFAQNLGVNATGATPHNSSIIDLNTGNTFTSPNGKGLLPPNVALTGITDAVTVTSPATSLWVYNTATANTGTAAIVPGYYYWDGAKWVRLQTTASTAQDWSLLGNAGTTAGTNFLGTTDAQDVVVKTNGVENMRILNSNGRVGIGTATPISKLHIFDGTITQTQSTNISHSILMRNPSGRDWQLYHLSPSDANAPNGFMFEHFNGTVWQRRMTIDQTGNVGIGIVTPGAKLHVVDNQNIRTLHIEHNFNGLVNTDAAFIGGIDAGYSSTGLFVLQKDNVSFGSAGTNLINVVSNSVSQMVINGLGNVGIGTSSPGAKLDVVGRIQVSNVVDNVFGTLQGASSHDLVGTYAGWDVSGIYLAGYNAVNLPGSRATNKIYFGGPGSTRMMVDLVSGNVGIGTIAPLSRLDVMGAKPGASAGTGVANDAPSQAIIPAGSDGSSRQNDWPNTWGGGISTWDICGATIYMSGYVTRSDIRLKKDIVSMGSDITKTFMQLRPVTYLLKKEMPETAGLQYGFIAQEVAQLFPSIVTKDSGLEGATIGMNYQALIAPTIYIVQQQQLQIQELIDKNNALQKQMAEIIALLKKN